MFGHHLFLSQVSFKLTAENLSCLVFMFEFYSKLRALFQGSRDKLLFVHTPGYAVLILESYVFFPSFFSRDPRQNLAEMDVQLKTRK